HLDPSQVTVSGPVSLAKQVRRAIARLPLESLSAQRESDSVSVPLELQDETGHTIVSPLLRISNESITLDAVQIDVTVYPMREVPVDVGSAVRGLPAHGYEVGDVHLTPSSVLVAAPLDVLDRLTMLYVESPLDVENATQSQLGGSNIRYLPDLAYTSIGEVVVQVEIRQAQHTHTYDNRTIIPMNVPPEMQATLSVPYMAVVLTGNYRDLEPLEAAQIHLYVDATGLSAGTHTLAVQCRVDGLTDFQFAAQTPTVELTLQAKNPSASAGK
ncbi:MAG: CdaR family protein, partial [Clostridia bacterium]